MHVVTIYVDEKEKIVTYVSTVWCKGSKTKVN